MIQFKCMQRSKVEREKEYRINMVKEHLPSFLVVAAQSLVPCSLESSRTTKHLNSDDLKISIQTINKTTH
jgi:hypothetical protein